MRPVRVTTAGGSAVLPLRMVAAGTGPKVGITLWVVAEARYEAQNFPNFAIKSEDIVWDWAKNGSNFAELRAAKSADGKSWETESSTTFTAQAVANAVRNGYYGGQGGFGGGAPASGNDYAPVTDTNGAVLKTADQVREADLVTLVDQMSSLRITRLRADLAHASLAADLVLQPAADPGELLGQRQATKEAGQPQCPVFNGCSVDGTAPRDVAIARAKANASSFACNVHGDGSSGGGGGAPLGLAALAGFLGLAFARARRRG